MSTTTTTMEPPAVKKRGRPRKVVPEISAASARDVKKTGIREASTKSTPVKEKAAAAKAEKKAPGRPKTIAPKAKAATAPSASPVTPATSKILEKVRAAGTLKVTGSSSPPATATANATPDVKSSTPQTPAAKPTPATPTSTPVTQPTAPVTSSTPTHSPSQSTIKPTPPRTTTIPLPRAPRVAPSPTTTFAKSMPKPSPKPMPTGPTQRIPPSNPHPHAHNSTHHQSRRLIEPTPDMRLPAKYKPAARRITAIMVGIPIIIVVGWELYQRLVNGKVQKKFEDREEGKGLWMR